MERSSALGLVLDAPTLDAAKKLVGSQIGPDDKKEPSATGKGRYATFVTSDISGEPTFIWLDLSWLRDFDIEGYANLRENESVQILLTGQADGSFLARQYQELAKGSKVNNTDWGITVELPAPDPEGSSTS